MAGNRPWLSGRNETSGLVHADILRSPRVIEDLGHARLFLYGRRLYHHVVWRL